MIIDKSDIEKAKEKLGDQNAFLIADLLELDDFDEKNLKACCPYHNENTASFIYNKKAHNWHCFGCNTTVDIIDVLMEKGNTFLEATKYLFDKADIQYSFGEKDVKTRHNYRYPHEEPLNEKKNVIEYFGKRGISKNVLDYLDVREDIHGNGVFNFYDTNDVLTMVKYRPSHTVEKHSGQPKTWCQKDADTSALLFNMNRVNTSKPLLVTEGECFKGDVEILTPNGWVRFDEYNDEKVLQIKENLSCEFVTPIAKIHKKYSGNMYTLEKGGNFSLTTTEEHNWVYVDYKNRLTKRKICDFPKNIGSGYIPTTVHLDGKGIGLTDDWIALWLAISADGTIDKRKESTTNYCRIQFKKERKIERFECLLKKCNLEYSKTKPPSNKSYTFFGVKIPKFITKELPWSWVTNATIEQRDFIISEIVHWDGNHVPNRNQFEYSSKIYYNAMLIQTIAHTSGYMSTIMKRKNSYGEWYKVSILFSKKGVSYQDGISDISNYDGDVYCVTVPSGMILVRQNGHIAVCGNCDAMSAIESGYLNTVSVPLGAGNLHWIEENWDWLDNFDSIIIWSDNDEPGIKMRKECIYRLGTWRTKYISTPEFFEKDNGKRVPLKDINDCLQVGGKDFVMNLISEAKDVPVKSVVDYSEIDELDISQMDGIKTGIKPLDNELVSLFYGTLTILSGRPGSGKTSLIDQAIATTIDDGSPVFLYSKELPERLSANWFNTIIAGRRNMVEKVSSNGKSYYVVPYSTQKKMQSYYNKKLFIYKDEEPNDYESVMKSAEECVRKFGCKLIVLDNLMMIDLKCNESDKNTAQTDLINLLIKFAVKFNVAVVLIAHPRKTQDSNSDIEMYDIAGSSNIINLAMRSIGLRRVSKKEKEDAKCKWKNYDVVLTVMKDRMFGKSDVQIGLWYDLVSRRFYTDYLEYAKQFAWDDNVYTDKLPYVDRTEDNTFPDK